MTTLRDIARAAGVSTASASRAIAGKTPVSAELHARIMAAVARLDYRPNLVARALASRHSSLVGLVATDLEDAPLARVAAAAQQALERRGYGVLLVTGSTQRSPGTAALAARGAEGLLFLGRAPAGEESAALAAQRLTWMAVADGGADTACFDLGRLRAAELACRYLLEMGHRILGLLTLGELPAEALCARLGRAGAVVHLVRPSSGDAIAIRSTVHTLLAAPQRPSAIVCTSDLGALIAVQECAIQGIRVPGEVSVVGCGDQPFGRWSRPALSTVRLPCVELGGRAADALADALAGGAPRPSGTPAVKLVIRETSERP